MTQFNHSRSLDRSAIIRETVFGMEDGMVSTLGAITGIAVGSGDQFTTLLSGAVIITVESVSMGVGSYLSNRISKEVDLRTIREEKMELIKYPSEEKRELYEMFVRDGWPKPLAVQMTKYANLSKHLMLREMQYRELGISPYRMGNPLKSAIMMYFAYIIGGLIALFPYFFVPVSVAVLTSIVVTLGALFVLGLATTKYSVSPPVVSGTRMLILGGVALAVGVMIGEISKLFL